MITESGDVEYLLSAGVKRRKNTRFAVYWMHR